MATDYRFAMQCWQDSAGSENAKVNIFVNDTQVATEVEITATDSASPQVVSFEATGLPDPNADGSVTCNIRVVLVNEYYVDASTDRNIWISAIGTLPKDMIDNIYYGVSTKNLTIFTDFTEFAHLNRIPTSVTGDQIPDGFWDDALSSNTFYYIPIYGSSTDTSGVTITWALYP